MIKVSVLDSQKKVSQRHNRAMYCVRSKVVIQRLGVYRCWLITMSISVKNF